MPGPGDTHVTILLSTHEGAAWLPELLASVRTQSHTDWTMLVRDDGSTDESVAVVRAEASADDRIRLVRDDLGNLGPAGSYLQLLGRVEQGLFAFCDQDDIWFPHKLAWTVEALAGAPAVAAVYTDAEVVDADGAPLAPSALALHRAPTAPTPGALLVNNVAIGATMVGTAALAERAVTIAAGRPVLMHDWWCAVLAAHGGELRALPHPTLSWRRHTGTVTGATPTTIAGRMARRRRYARWTAVSARWILDAGVGAADPEAARAVRAAAEIDPDRLRVGAWLRAWRAGGVRAHPLSRQLGLLSAVVMGRSDQ